MYNKNLEILLNGHTNFPVDPPQKVVGDEDTPKLIYRNQTPADTKADARDILSFLTAKGYTSLNDKESKAAYNSLTKTVGTPLAQKLLTQVLIFNQRPDVAKYSPEQRADTFYSIGSNDKQVNDYLGQIKAFGSGIKAGFQDSSLINNRFLSGREQQQSDELPTDNNLNDKIKKQIAKISK